MTERLLKSREVAELLGLSIDTVLDKFEAGDLPGYRLGGRKGGPVRFRLSQIEARLAEWHTEGAAASQGPAPDIGGTDSHATPILRPVRE